MDKKRDCDVITWAQNLGFRVENENFVLNSKKLVCPVLKPIWRHLIKNVKSRDKVALIRKQLLLFNLQSQSDTAISRKIKNLKDFALYKENKILTEGLVALDGKIEQNVKEIKNLENIIENNAQKEKIVEKEEEDFKKLEIIAYYSNSLTNQKENIQHVQSLISNSKSFEDKVQDFYLQKIDNFWDSLQKNQEIEKITALLMDCLKKKIPDMNFSMSSNLINEMEKLQEEKFLSLQTSEKTKIQIENELQLNKDLLVAEGQVKVDSSFIELWKKLLDTKLEHIKQRSVHHEIRSFLNSKSMNHEVILNDRQEIISELQIKMASVIEKIKVYNKNYVAIENYFLEVDLQNDARNLPSITEFKSIIFNIKQLFKEIEENVLKLDLNSFKNLFKCDIKMSSKKLFTINSFEKSSSDIEKEINFSFEIPELKDSDSSSLIDSIKDKENDNLTTVTRVLDQLRIQLSIINNEIRDASTALEFWMNPPVNDHLPISDRYQQLRKRYETAFSELKKVV